MKEAKDHFSQVSEGYHKYRPTYPAELFNTIYKHCSNFETAWDCATGNGQAAEILAEKFTKVFATDISKNQLKFAPKTDNIIYSVQRAESTIFEDNFFDLICVAQAVHWFDIVEFNQEVSRILKKDGNLAVWGYDLVMVNSKIDEILDYFYNKVVGKFWDAERKSIELHYQDLEFKFRELPILNSFEFNTSWNLDHFIGYINSWSAVKNYIKANGENPVDTLREKLEPIWGNEYRRVIFPIFLRLFKNSI